MEIYDYVGLGFIVVLLAACIAISIYIFVYFSHPLDQDIPGTWVLRITIIIGFVFAFGMVFMLPIDYLSAYIASVKKQR